jgi:hypothetical protein
MNDVLMKTLTWENAYCIFNGASISERCSSVCANCFSSCTECDVLNQKCTACQESKFGDLCQLDCPQHCKTCNINNGTCLECKPGHGGDNCTGIDYKYSLLHFIYICHYSISINLRKLYGSGI